jgi:hypothetical protein
MRTTCSGRRAEGPLREAIAMGYRIDYDRIDVADIMAQVRMKAAEGPPETPAAGQAVPPLPSEAPAGGAAVAPLAPEVPAAGPADIPSAPPVRGWKGLLKKTARFLVRPYLPILLPFTQWLKFRLNYEVNVRIDGTATRLEKVREDGLVRIDETAARLGTVWQEAVVRIDETTTRLGKSLEKVSARSDGTATRLETTRDEIVTRLDEMATRFQMTRDEIAVNLGTTRETVKLLHTLGHNLAFELTKLKIEEEALKSKVRVLEKELETLGKREKAIEKKVFE